MVFGCGYLGCRVSRAWLEAGHAVAALTRTSARARQLAEVGIQPWVGDVTNPGSLSALPPAETVLYAVGFDRRGTVPRPRVVVEGLANVLVSLGPSVRRLIFISSMSVYGQTNGEWVDEDSPCQPVRENGRVGLEAEQTLRRHFTRTAGSDGPSVQILRLAGIYGPGRLIGRIEALRVREPIRARPDAWLNLIHVDDAVSAVLACAERGRPATTYLVSDDQPVTRREYFESLARLAGTPPPVFDSTRLDESRALGRNKRCCNRRLREELGVTLLFPTITTGLPDALAGRDGA